MPFAVTLSAAASQTVTVSYTTLNGTAGTPKDYVSQSGTLTFAPGDTSKTITVQIVGDTTKESNETLTVRLSNPSNATIAKADGIGTIIDDDSTPRLAVSSTSLVEGNSGQKMMTFAVAPSNGDSLQMSVDYATVAGPSAREGVDYLPVAGTLVFPPESTDPQFITVPIVGNLRHQPTHKVFLRLLNAIEAVLDGIDGQGDIVDDDPIPSITINDVTVGEPISGTVNAVVNVTLSNDTDDVVTVNYSTGDGTAVAGTDYLAASGRLTFQPGVMTQPITITINPASSYTGTESFYVNLSSPANATTARSTAVVTLTPPTAWVASTTADFQAGTLGSGAYLSETGNGEVTLAPTVGTEFSGTALPTGWTSTVLQTGGGSTVANGSIRVDGASVLAPTTYTAGHTLEFVATFSGAPNQNAVFGLTTALLPPFAMFGVKTDGQLYARSVAPGQAFETAIPGSWFSGPHRFRIDWNATNVVYWIDGTQVMAHTITYKGSGSSMRPAITDLTVGDGALSVSWMRMTAYATSGTYTSSVYDASASVAWQTASWVTDSPAGTK